MSKKLNLQNNPKILEQIKTLYLKNVPIRTIAKELNLTDSTIHYWIDKLELRKISMKNYYEVHGDTTYIYISKRNGKKFTVLIDTEDLPKVMNIKNSWSASEMKNGVYATAYDVETVNNITKKKTILMHRAILNPPDNKVIDHINHNTLDNRKSNLRIVSISENTQNLKEVRKNNTSGVRGVYYSTKRKRWVAQLNINKKKIHVGCFTDIKDAEIAIKNARKKYMPYSYEALKCED